MMGMLVALITISQIDSARTLIDRGRYQEAAKVLENYVRREGKDDWEAYKLLIEVYGTLKKPEKALHWAEEALKEFPDDPTFLHYRAIILDNLDNLDRAIIDYRYLFERFPDSVSYMVNYGNALYRIGQYDRAQAVLEKAVDILESRAAEPGITFRDMELLYKSLIILSYIYHKRGDKEKAVQTTLKAMQYSMDRKAFYDYALALLFNTHEYVKLANIMKRAVRLYPQEPNYHKYLGLAQYMLAVKSQKQEEKDSLILESIRSLSTALGLKPDPVILYYLAKDYQLLKKRNAVMHYTNLCYYLDEDCRFIQVYELLDEGEIDRALQIALTIDINTSFEARVLAYAFEKAGKTGLAEKYLKLAIALDPSNTERYRSYMTFLLRHGKIREYYRILKKYAALKPDDPQAYYDLANHYNAEGKYDSASIYYARAAELLEKELDTTSIPENYRLLSFVYNNWGYMLVDRGIDVKKGFELLKKALQLNPTDASILDSMGWALYKMGSVEDAYGYIKRAHELKPDDEEITKHFMEIQKQMQSPEKGGSSPGQD